MTTTSFPGIHCKDALNDTTCGAYGVFYLDPNVHAVLTREEPGWELPGFAHVSC